MNHHVEIMSNKKIIFATIGEKLSLSEWADVSRQIMDCINVLNGSVHVIVDMSQTKTHPLNTMEINRVTIWAKDPKIKTINHITNNRMTSILGELVISLVANTYGSMQTRDEAFKRIVDSDPSIMQSAAHLMMEVQ
ncbi:MAG: hypothetical protein AAF846_16675 [Chloroflexota bacterium]